MRHTSFRHEFVDEIPEVLEESVVYVCIPYATVLHKCACGCRLEVVTPLTPTDWSVSFNGASISLRPSIGNWSFPCQSHYWLRDGHVDWSARWSERKISENRKRDTSAKQHFYGEAASTSRRSDERDELVNIVDPTHRKGRFRWPRILRRDR